METTREFVISSTKKSDVENRLISIQDMFDVKIHFTSDPSTAARTGNTWLKVTGSSKESSEMAEEYVKSLCNAEHERIVTISKEFHGLLTAKSGWELVNYQRKSGAVIVLLGETQLLLQGTRTAVQRAVSLVESETSLSAIPDGAREFARKLGYSDQEIMEAAFNCANHVTENTLLQQLLASSASKNLNIDNAVMETNLLRENDAASSLSSEKLTKSELIGDGGSCNGLRSVIIDGSNVAMCHGNKTVFSCLGIKICVNWFRSRGHKDITVFVPQWRKETCNSENPISNQDILLELEREKTLVFTPSRRVNGRRVICYDDRYIVKLATMTDGIIVSNDNFRDLGKENPEWKQVIDQRLLMFSFVNNMFMPPDDPLGRHGPTLDDFLKSGPASQPKPCPYGKKCTYGQKCRFSHPERQSRSSLTSEEDSIRSHSCPPTGSLSPQSDSQQRRHSYSRPNQYSTCAAEYAKTSNSYPGTFSGDILARGSSAMPRRANPMESNSSSSQGGGTSNVRKNSMSKSLQYSQSNEQRAEHPAQYMHGVQHSPVLFYPNLYDPRIGQPYISGQRFIPPYQMPQQQYGGGMHQHSPQGYAVAGNHYVYGEPQQRFFPQEGIGCAMPPNMVNRIEMDRYCRSAPDKSKKSSNGSWVYLLEQLEEIFPGKRDCILKVMKDHPHEADISALAQFILAEE